MVRHPDNAAAVPPAAYYGRARRRRARARRLKLGRERLGGARGRLEFLQGGAVQQTLVYKSDVDLGPLTHVDVFLRGQAEGQDGNLHVSRPVASQQVAAIRFGVGRGSHYPLVELTGSLGLELALCDGGEAEVGGKAGPGLSSSLEVLPGIAEAAHEDESSG